MGSQRVRHDWATFTFFKGICATPTSSSALRGLRGPTLLTRHTLLVLDWAGQPERRGIPPAPADLTFSPLAAFLADPGTKQGNASWGGREHAIPPASQGSEPQQTVSNEHTWPPGQQTTGFHAREMAEANFVFQIAFVFHQLLWHHGWFHLPCKAGTLHGILEFFTGHPCLVHNTKLNQVF